MLAHGKIWIIILYWWKAFSVFGWIYYSSYPLSILVFATFTAIVLKDTRGKHAVWILDPSLRWERDLQPISTKPVVNRSSLITNGLNASVKELLNELTIYMLFLYRVITPTCQTMQAGRDLKFISISMSGIFVLGSLILLVSISISRAQVTHCTNSWCKRFIFVFFFSFFLVMSSYFNLSAS